MFVSIANILFKNLQDCIILFFKPACARSWNSTKHEGPAGTWGIPELRLPCGSNFLGKKNMLRYELDKTNNKSLYECLYEYIRDDILRGRIIKGEKLPSKRELAAENGISVKTVLSAYEQLLLEGYVYSKERQGYFVADVEKTPKYNPDIIRYMEIYREDEWFADFTANETVYEMFPFSTWKKVMREVLTQYDMELVRRSHFLGVKELREVIALYLYRNRGIKISPECIVIGAGVEYLYSKLIKLLPENAKYAVENPSYKKLPKIYDEYGLKWVWTEMDREGINMDSLREVKADIIHVSPEHHYPLGTVMSVTRRQELLAWALEEEDRYIIEDDYDCEFRYRTNSIFAMKSMDIEDRVIYMNTFSKTLAPSIRISYMVLPESLMIKYINMTNFYSNTASTIEQYALCRFIEKGYFERHISRLKKYFHNLGEKLIKIIKNSKVLPIQDIRGGESGTHILLRMNTKISDCEIKKAAMGQGINIACLSDFCSEVLPEFEHTLVMNYLNLSEDKLKKTIKRLEKIFV